MNMPKSSEAHSRATNAARTMQSQKMGNRTGKDFYNQVSQNTSVNASYQQRVVQPLDKPALQRDKTVPPQRKYAAYT